MLRWSAFLLSGGCVVYWLVVAAMVVRTRLVLPTLRRGLRLPPSDQSVCIVIPAHNEASSIARLIDSLRTQDHPNWSALLTLDRCTDATAAIAQQAIAGDPRLTVLEIDECPEDWAGKVHAVWHAVETTPQARKAQSLLFIDADTWMHPGCVRAAMALKDHRGDHLLSVLSTLELSSWYERLAQCVAGFVLTIWYPPERASRQQGRRPFANGQFLLFDRAAYDAIGGHRAVKDHLLEDMEFARLIYASRLRASVLLANGMHRCRMYDNWPSFVRGWKRIYTECANRRVARLNKAAAKLLLTACLLPAAGLACVFLLPWLGWSALGAFGLGILAIAWAGNVSPVGVAGFPLGAVLVARILFAAAHDLRRGVPTQWAGRSYVREAR